VIVSAVTLRGFRSYERAEVRLGSGMTVVAGRNGVGKSNLLEAIYFACTGRSCRTSNERECVRFGDAVLRLELEVESPPAGIRSAAPDRPHARDVHKLCTGFQPGESKRFTVDGAPIERLADSPSRPLVSVFLPDRLELIAGTPSLRRAHIDQVVVALWPARTGTRKAYAAALAQRNALVAAIRAGRAGRGSLPAWDAELARHGVALMADRAATVERLRPRYAEHAAGLGLDGEAELTYRPRSSASTAEVLAAELAERVESDLQRGFTGHGPHRDELSFRLDGRDLRPFGSRGQQRLALLSLLLAEREELADARGVAPLMLLDDPMSELDAGRRERLVDVLRRGGQSVLAATELGLVPGADAADVTRVAIVDGAILQTAASEAA
jgi:DNA replication and repair protein RecF